jgi:hypothetical protein
MEPTRGKALEKPKELPREPAPEVVERADVKVAGSLARCPYCHEGIATDAPNWVSCRSCLARHHEDCWKERLACSSCGHNLCLGGAVEYVQVDRPAVHVANERPWVRKAYWTLTALMVPSLLLLTVLFGREGDWGTPLVFGAATLGWLAYGHGFAGQGRVRAIEKQPR